jgi:hypothetical protein
MVSKNLTFKQGVFVEKINCGHGTHILARSCFMSLLPPPFHEESFHQDFNDTMEGIWKVILTILNSLQENDF